MIDLYQAERALLGLAPNPDADLATVAGCDDRGSAQGLWDNSHAVPAGSLAVADAGWVGKLAAKLWVIRADERPVAP